MRCCNNCGHGNHMDEAAIICHQCIIRNCVALNRWIPIDQFFCKVCGEYLCGKHRKW